MDITYILSRIRNLQAGQLRTKTRGDNTALELGTTPPEEHKPEMLLIGCIDARLNLKDDVGIPDGKALIYRNIAALVGGKDNERGNKNSVAATLEFAVNNMHVKNIVVMGHTHCGGIHACVSGGHEGTEHIKGYLDPLEGVRAKVAEAGGTQEEQERAMEKEAVRNSLDNLMGYDVVRKAVESGKLSIEGWLIDTGTKLIWEMDPKTREFSPIGAAKQAKISL